jgi:aminoglycoside 2''-phosphotransferase
MAPPVDVPAYLLERIRAAFPGLPLRSVRLDPDGLVNTVLMIDDQWVCRFAKDERGIQALARETQILDLVRRHVALAVPAFEYQEPDFVAYRLIRGSPLNRQDLEELDPRQQERLGEQLATFLYQLHSIPEAELEQHAIGRSDAQRTPDDWERLYADVKREMFPFLWRDERDWVTHHFATLQTGRLDLGSYEPALIHGDLAQYHVLFNPATADLTGIIDFGTAGLGDPAGDFAVMISMYGERFLQRMARMYPAIAEALDRARFWAGTMELQWALAGLRSDDRSWFVAHIGRARDMGRSASRGRRSNPSGRRSFTPPRDRPCSAISALSGSGQTANTTVSAPAIAWLTGAECASGMSRHFPEVWSTVESRAPPPALSRASSFAMAPLHWTLMPPSDFAWHRWADARNLSGLSSARWTSPQAATASSQHRCVSIPLVHRVGDPRLVLEHRGDILDAGDRPEVVHMHGEGELAPALGFTYPASAWAFSSPLVMVGPVLANTWRRAGVGERAIDAKHGEHLTKLHTSIGASPHLRPQRRQPPEPLTVASLGRHSHADEFARQSPSC